MKAIFPLYFRTANKEGKKRVHRVTKGGNTIKLNYGKEQMLTK
jgi:hypothetical protein